MKTKSIVLLLLLIFAAAACNPDVTNQEPVDFGTGWFAASPQNLSFLNTEYDDYNMNIYYVGKVLDLYYSSNKGSGGNEFDITSRRLEAGVNSDTGILDFGVLPSEPTYAWKLLPKINTDSDEFGPFSFYSDAVVNSGTKWYFFYASNEPGNFDIRFAYTIAGDWDGSHSQQQIFGPFDAALLNSESDDFYPAVNADHSRIYFSSNRNEGYDIFEVDLNSDDIVSSLQEGVMIPAVNAVLSGPDDDKCPYIKGNLMVFASNRPSGYGGFDLWYSVFENGNWGEPQNFGPEINTEFDEYRPAVEYFPHSNNDLMIFSSNRPGGRGGFDLYYTGISKMTGN